MKNRKVYIRLIITYLVVFLIPMIISIVSLEKIADDTGKSISESVLANLEHAKSTMDNNIRELDSIVYKLSANTTVRSVATQIDTKNKYVKISRLKSAQEIMKAMQVQTFVEEYYLYLHKSNMILSPEHIFLDEDSCKTFFQYNEMPWNEWKNSMRKDYSKVFLPSAMTKQNSKNEERILYIQSLSAGAGNRGTFVFPVKEEYIVSLLKDSYVPSEGWAYIADKEGNILVDIPTDEGEFSQIPQRLLEGNEKIKKGKLDGRSVEIIRSYSEESGLSFIAVLPREYINQQVSIQQKNMLALLVCVVGVGLVFICILTWYRGHKIDKIMQMLFAVQVKNDEDNNLLKGDELSYISESLKKLINSNTDLQDSIKKKEVLTQSLLLQSLLNGTEEKSEKEVNRNLEEYGIHLQRKRLLVCAYQLYEKNQETVDIPIVEISIYKQVFQKEWNQIFTGKNYFCDLGITTGAVICTIDEKEELSANRLKESMIRLQNNFKENYSIQVRVAIGTECREISQISRSYDQIYEMLQYGATSNINILLYEEHMNTGEYYYYPMPLEERLVNAVRTGNKENLHEQLREVYQVNVLEKNVNSDMMHFLVNDMQCTVFRALHSLNGQVEIQEQEIHGELQQLSKETDILVRFNKINRIFNMICTKVQESNKEANGKQKEIIQTYINENYDNSELSLTKIADDFGYSSTYFSKLFKELFQENFAAYLEKVRIENVCILLKGEDTMLTIAEKTGYNSVYVMRTAFKRVKGLTPNDYRKMKGGGGN